MNYIDTINGYAIYEASQSMCKKHGYCYPSFFAFLNPEDNVIPGHEECSLETFEDLAEWCEKN